MISSLQQLKPLLMQLLRFGLVGGLATVVHLAMAWWAIQQWPELSPFWVNLIAFVVAFQVSFWGHSRFTFRQQGHWLKFLSVTVTGFAINNSFLWVFLTLGVEDSFLAICLSVALVPLFVFVASKLWVFAQPR
ncbi:polysaccharide biosynthesis protein GtrA [Bacterioplanes sanyensis]|uniref:Polysaccharide biosynthesis protein GtrA n=1 Tax=Bacterioplanes sanyensis TaxID=1249553 RepID=A0A222FEH1_9GAMM|nr:GtrA family protein [Bacterioplanes sanyensis]ASP37497.1 polysaccharide biosynthesis protein GtrA [Bacterioplanes sanyensis]